jgi:hypothetical protein
MVRSRKENKVFFVDFKMHQSSEKVFVNQKKKIKNKMQFLD